MIAIEPDMVMGKAAIGGDGERLGEVVDVGLFSHSRVKYLVVEDKAKGIPIRMYAAETIDSVSSDIVRLKVG
jgi:hypothetical protein